MPLFDRISSLKRPDHSTIYFILLIGLAGSLPVSEFSTSVFEILLALNWIAEGQFRRKLRNLRRRTSLLLILSIYAVHLAGFLYSSDVSFWLHDIRIKLPLLVLPLIIGTSEFVSYRRLRVIIWIFTGSILVSTFISSAILFRLVDYEINDIRDISIFIDHIRFSLMINISIFSLVYILFDQGKKMRPVIKTGIILAVAWMIIFLFLLRSYSGILIFFITGSLLFLVRMNRIEHLVLRWFLFVLILTVPLIGLSYITGSIAKFYSIKETEPAALDEYTENGNKYRHYFEEQMVENGRYVWLYVCEKELEKEWNTVSDIDYRGKDLKDQEIKYTLIRYLTSKGFRKDSAGVARLEPSDIEAIENGLANYIYKDRLRIYPNVYEIIWQVDVYRKGGNPSGHSVTQRILYVRAALSIIRENFLIGVGNGDLPDAYKEYYLDTMSELSEHWRLRAHNQYLTFFASFGIIGFLWIFGSFIIPVFMERKWGNFYFLMFFLVGFLSMLNEDTLETHIGISFFSFFYALLLFGIPGKDLTEEENKDKPDDEDDQQDRE